jgi:hypothetical protein
MKAGRFHWLKGSKTVPPAGFKTESKEVINGKRELIFLNGEMI